ncbi:MAG: transcription antitermination factor NusB [Chloroflexota bacterium]
MVGERRKARGVALQALYELDRSQHDLDSVVNRLLAEVELSEENGSFVRELVNKVIENKEKLDEHIKRFAPAWPLAQIPAIDRNILRLAIFEVLFDNKVSIKIAINEAVELAKRFGSDSSPKFINGVLGSVSALVKDESKLKGR